MAEGYDNRISLQKLEVFCLVVELGGVSRAAEHLFVALALGHNTGIVVDINLPQIVSPEPAVDGVLGIPRRIIISIVRDVSSNELLVDETRQPFADV